MSDLQTQRKACFAQTAQHLREALTDDQLVVQATNTIHDLHKMSNQLAKRLREWSGWWVPELDHEMKDHEKFIELLIEGNQEKDSVGAAIKDQDRAPIIATAALAQSLYAQKEALLQYVETILKEIMPNTLIVCGTPIAADLLTATGSMKRFAMLPSSTIQLLGAETALFRHLKNKKNRPPKHGIIFNHPLLQRAPKELRGKVARALADKITVAARVDYFKGDPCGERYREELEKKFGGSQ